MRRRRNAERINWPARRIILEAMVQRWPKAVPATELQARVGLEDRMLENVIHGMSGRDGYPILETERPKGYGLSQHWGQRTKLDRIRAAGSDG